MRKASSSVPRTPLNAKTPTCGGFVNAAERIRTSTDHTVHKALNLGHLGLVGCDPASRRLFGSPVTLHFRSVWSPNWSPTGAISADRGCRRDGGQGARTLLGPSSRRGVQKAPAKSWPEDSRPGQMTRSAPVHETGSEIFVVVCHAFTIDSVRAEAAPYSKQVE